MTEKNRTILVVDDEPDICEILGLMFESKGFNVLTANNGKDAFEIVKAKRIDVIVSDIQMPGGDGVVLLDEVKKHNSSLPVVLFITGYASITVEDAYDKGAEAVFAKPFDNKALLQAVVRAIAEMESNEGAPRAVREVTDFDIEVKFPHFEISRKVKMANLGRGGFFVNLESTLPQLNDEVSFKIKVEGEVILNISGTGTVKWVRPKNENGFSPGCGVEFLTFEGDSKGKIFEFINFLKTKQYIPKL